MFPAAFISCSHDFRLHFHFQCAGRANLIDISIHSADVYTLVMACVGYPRVRGQKPFRVSLKSNVTRV